MGHIAVRMYSPDAEQRSALPPSPPSWAVTLSHPVTQKRGRRSKLGRKATMLTEEDVPVECCVCSTLLAIEET